MDHLQKLLKEEKQGKCSGTTKVVQKYFRVKLKTTKLIELLLSSLFSYNTAATDSGYAIFF